MAVNGQIIYVGRINKIIEVGGKIMAISSTRFKKGHIPWIKGKHHSNRTKDLLSEMNKGKHHSEETKEKIRKSNRRENNFSWKGGFIKDTDGYMLFNVPDGCRFSCMKNRDGYIAVHRLVMASYLQRPLKPKEIVHHINRNINDNKVENLELLGIGEHLRLHRESKRGINGSNEV